MASRFTSTKIWDEDWFCEMPGEYQLFVKYMFDKCDNAGVWKPNKFDFETKTKFKVGFDHLFKKLNGDGQQRVLLLENGRWFLTGYILFQWFNKKKTFDLVLTNRLHKSLYDILVENKIDLKKVRGLKEVLQGSMVMVVEEKTVFDFGKSENLLHGIVPQMMAAVKKMFPRYPEDQETDFSNLMAIAYKIGKELGITPAEVTGLKRTVVVGRWCQIMGFIAGSEWYAGKAIKYWNKDFQGIVQAFQNEKKIKNGPGINSTVGKEIVFDKA